ncbi:SIMPL domain-containing protein [Hyphomicrobium sp. D-2]|uniref:SIMPL domain-containing protein n=1 Tax=Hyphomicrobium sp. D-2 TaxID=3041621 RepID=UPI002458FF34|nr:SIMPL domain-containing protein [Hyphomicrobium sp. D-2]MDH4983814.1 SIMPL domain-containing protein [Hyphomicrobium sp. D-2]
MHTGLLSIQGTAIVRVEPDLALIRLAVSRTAPALADAFSRVRTAAQNVRAFLIASGNGEIRSSRIALHQSGIRPPPYAIEGGYVATVNFSCVVADLEAVESVLTGVVSSGANRLTAIEFLTSKLQAARTEARRRAVLVAQEKANFYCEALGARLGEVVNISESDFDASPRQSEHGQLTAAYADSDEKLGTFSPSSIPVGATVNLQFRLL